MVLVIRTHIKYTCDVVYTLSLFLRRVLILQATYRHYIHAVLALVGKVAYGSKNHEKRGSLHLVGVDS